jgi:hypothetical protein
MSSPARLEISRAVILHCRDAGGGVVARIEAEGLEQLGGTSPMPTSRQAARSRRS